jgi:DNA adenine methylase
MAKPVLKWVGGKRKVVDSIYSKCPQEYNHFHEPFFGSGALFFEFEPQNGTINDANTRLMNFYRQVRDNPDELIELLYSFEDPRTDPDPEKEFAERNRRGERITDRYYQYRELFNRRAFREDFDPLKEAALLLYLNQTCFNGLYRENSNGEFNVPIGGHNSSDWGREDEIQAASNALKNTEIKNQDFDYILDEAREGDLVYFDPPIMSLDAANYYSDYSPEWFSHAEQERLWKVAKQLARCGVHVIIHMAAQEVDEKPESLVEAEGVSFLLGDIEVQET